MNLRVDILSHTNDDFWRAFDALAFKVVDHIPQINSIWLRAYITNYLKPKQVKIITVYDNNNLVGCLPLQLEYTRATRFWNFRVLKILGCGPTDFFDVVLANNYKAEAAEAIVDYLLNKGFWDKLELTDIPENSENLNYLIKAFNEKESIIEIDKPNGYRWINTTQESWKSYSEEIFNDNNKDLLKAERRLNNDGIEVFTETYSKDVYLILQNCLEIYAQRRESLGQSNSYEVIGRQLFLKNVIEHYEKNNNVEITLLKDQKSTILAFQLDWIFNHIRYHWNHAYNENYKRYSPGKLLLKHLLIKSFEDDHIHYCNHMRGLSGYKDKFTTFQMSLIRLRIQNPKSVRIYITNIISYLLKYLKN